MRITRTTIILTLATWLTMNSTSAQSPEQASGRLAAAQALLAADTNGQAFRTDATIEGGVLLLRFTPTDRDAELRVAPTPARRAMEARVKYAADGGLDSVKVRGSLTPRPRVRVSPGSSDAERNAAAASLRYNSTKADDVRQLARVRGTVLGEQAAAGGAEFKWHPADDGTGLQPVWVVQVSATRSRAAVPYAITLDATDGSLIEVKRGSPQ